MARWDDPIGQAMASHLEEWENEGKVSGTGMSWQWKATKSKFLCPELISLILRSKYSV
jgi:hypothetical protein